MSLDLVPAMVNILPNEGSGFECESGVNKYVNTSPGGVSVYVNVCCTDIVAIPGDEASAKAPYKLIRETNNSTIESAKHMSRLLYCNLPVFLILVISESFGQTRGPVLRATALRGRGFFGCGVDKCHKGLVIPCDIFVSFLAEVGEGFVFVVVFGVLCSSEGEYYCHYFY